MICKGLPKIMKRLSYKSLEPYGICFLTFYCGSYFLTNSKYNIIEYFHCSIYCRWQCRPLSCHIAYHQLKKIMNITLVIHPSMSSLLRWDNISLKGSLLCAHFTYCIVDNLRGTKFQGFHRFYLSSETKPSNIGFIIIILQSSK